MAAAMMWMMNQTLCSAGTSGATATYHWVTASPTPTVNSSVMPRPSQRIPHLRATNRYSSAANASVEVMNSYMLPHGGRSAATPRKTTAVTCMAAATTVNTRPRRPKRSTRVRAESSEPSSGRTADWPRAAAHSTAWAPNAIRYTTAA